MAYKKGRDIVDLSFAFLPCWMVFHFVVMMIGAVDRLVFRIRIEGKENLTGLSQAILVSNHTLLLDPAVIAHVLMPYRTYFTMLEETALVPFLGTFVRLLGGIPIPESPAALLTVERAAKTAFRQGGFIHFFPEGECYRWSQEIQPFRPGAFMLAQRLDLPVVPITTILYERRIFGRRSFRLAGKTFSVPPLVTIVIGKPVHPTGGLNGRGAVIAMARSIRQSMQATIDEKNGSKSIYRGQMPRLVKKAPPPARASQTEARGA